MLKVNDEMLERLGIYFVYHEVHTRYGITFELFVERNQRGTWEL